MFRLLVGLLPVLALSMTSSGQSKPAPSVLSDEEIRKILKAQTLRQVEILFIIRGTVHIPGGQERDLHAGGTVFIPAYTQG